MAAGISFWVHDVNTLRETRTQALLQFSFGSNKTLFCFLTVSRKIMNTPLMFAVYALLALVAVPATRELLRTTRENAKRARLIPIRIDQDQRRQFRDPRDR
jgi:hypothetical protein